MTVGELFRNIGSWFNDGMEKLVTFDFLNLTVGQGIFTIFYFGIFTWIVFSAFEEQNGDSIQAALGTILIFFSPLIVKAYYIYL